VALTGRGIFCWPRRCVPGGGPDRAREVQIMTEQARAAAPGSQHSHGSKRAATAGVPMSGAQALIRALEESGVDTIFGYPGGAILPAYDPLLDSDKLRHVLV